MASTIFIDEETRKQWAHVFEQANKDPERYHNWILDEIEKAIELINRYDKIYVLGYIASKLIKASPNLMTRFFEDYKSDNPEEQEYINSNKIEDDDDVEVILEYAMNIASAETNKSPGTIPSEENLQEIYEQLLKIKHNVTIYIQAVQESDKRSLDDHRLRASVMGDTLNIRGQAYHGHFLEVFREMFEPHSGFIQQYYHFNTEDLLNTIEKLDTLVYSKIANVMGGAASHERYKDWVERQEGNVIPSISNFTKDNPDLFNEEAPENIVLYHLDDISSYNRIFWIVPQDQIQERIFNQLSHKFGDNAQFFLPPKFKAFPLGDSIIRNKPIIKDKEKYFCFSNHLIHRNIFTITDSLIESADPIYYQHTFRGNTNVNSRDMYLERKVKSLFEKMIPKGTFYHSLSYYHNDRENELDVLGIIQDKILIIEVKSGELNIKHRRGAIKGLKDRLEETINEGSFQCHRAESFINEDEKAKFQYVDENSRKELFIKGKYSI